MCLADDGCSPIPILYIGRSDKNNQYQSKYVDEYVPFSSFHLLSRIETMWTTNICRLNALAIQHPGRRIGIPPFVNAYVLAKRVIESIE